MMWFAAMVVMIDMVSEAVQEMHRNKQPAETARTGKSAARMPAFDKECYFADMNSMVTRKVKTFPESAGWQKLQAPMNVIK